VQKLSRTTTYIETYSLQRDNGEAIFRANTTGFFMRLKNQIILVTNWHVVTGLDPSDPKKLNGFAPEILKITVLNKRKMLTELNIPLYTLISAAIRFAAFKKSFLNCA
jgi:hypothetical protein